MDNLFQESKMDLSKKEKNKLKEQESFIKQMETERRSLEFDYKDLHSDYKNSDYVKKVNMAQADYSNVMSLYAKKINNYRFVSKNDNQDLMAMFANDAYGTFEEQEKEHYRLPMRMGIEVTTDRSIINDMYRQPKELVKYYDTIAALEREHTIEDYTKEEYSDYAQYASERWWSGICGEHFYKKNRKNLIKKATKKRKKEIMKFQQKSAELCAPLMSLYKSKKEEINNPNINTLSRLKLEDVRNQFLDIVHQDNETSAKAFDGEKLIKYKSDAENVAVDNIRSMLSFFTELKSTDANAMTEDQMLTAIARYQSMVGQYNYQGSVYNTYFSKRNAKITAKDPKNAYVLLMACVSSTIRKTIDTMDPNMVEVDFEQLGYINAHADLANMAASMITVNMDFRDTYETNELEIFEARMSNIERRMDNIKTNYPILFRYIGILSKEIGAEMGDMPYGENGDQAFMALITKYNEKAIKTEEAITEYVDNCCKEITLGSKEEAENLKNFLRIKSGFSVLEDKDYKTFKGNYDKHLNNRESKDYVVYSAKNVYQTSLVKFFGKENTLKEKGYVGVLTFQDKNRLKAARHHIYEVFMSVGDESILEDLLKEPTIRSLALGGSTVELEARISKYKAQYNLNLGALNEVLNDKSVPIPLRGYYRSRMLRELGSSIITGSFKAISDDIKVLKKSIIDDNNKEMVSAANCFNEVCEGLNITSDMKELMMEYIIENMPDMFNELKDGIEDMDVNIMKDNISVLYSNIKNMQDSFIDSVSGVNDEGEHIVTFTKAQLLHANDYMKKLILLTPALKSAKADFFDSLANRIKTTDSFLMVGADIGNEESQKYSSYNKQTYDMSSMLYIVRESRRDDAKAARDALIAARGKSLNRMLNTKPYDVEGIVRALKIKSMDNDIINRAITDIINNKMLEKEFPFMEKITSLKELSNLSNVNSYDLISFFRNNYKAVEEIIKEKDIANFKGDPKVIEGLMTNVLTGKVAVYNFDEEWYAINQKQLEDYDSVTNRFIVFMNKEANDSGDIKYNNAGSKVDTNVLYTRKQKHIKASNLWKLIRDYDKKNDVPGGMDVEDLMLSAINKFTNNLTTNPKLKSKGTNKALDMFVSGILVSQKSKVEEYEIKRTKAANESVKDRGFFKALEKQQTEKEDIIKKIKELEDRKALKVNMYEITKLESDKLKSSANKQEEEKKILENSLKDRQKERDDIQATFDNTVLDNKKLISLIDENTEQKTLAPGMLTFAKNNYNRLTTKLGELKAEIGLLEGAYKKYDVYMPIAMQDVNFSKQQIAAQNSVISKKEQEIKELDTKIEKYSADLKKITGTWHFLDQTKKIHELTNMLRAAEEERFHGLDIIEDNVKSRDDITSLIASKDQAIIEINMLNSTYGNKDNIKEIIEKKRRSYNYTLKAQEEAKTVLDEAQNEIARVIAESEKNLEGLSGQKDSLTEKVNSISSEIKKKDEEISGIEAKIADADKKLSDIKSGVDGYSKDILSQKTDIFKLMTDIDELKKSLEEKEKQIESTEKAIESAKQAYYENTKDKFNEIIASDSSLESLIGNEEAKVLREFFEKSLGQLGVKDLKSYQNEFASFIKEFLLCGNSDVIMGAGGPYDEAFKSDDKSYDEALIKIGLKTSGTQMFIKNMAKNSRTNRDDAQKLFNQMRSVVFRIETPNIMEIDEKKQGIINPLSNASKQIRDFVEKVNKKGAIDDGSAKDIIEKIEKANKSIDLIRTKSGMDFSKNSVDEAIRELNDISFSVSLVLEDNQDALDEGLSKELEDIKKLFEENTTIGLTSEFISDLSKKSIELEDYNRKIINNNQKKYGFESETAAINAITQYVSTSAAANYMKTYEERSTRLKNLGYEKLFFVMDKDMTFWNRIIGSDDTEFDIYLKNELEPKYGNLMRAINKNVVEGENEGIYSVIYNVFLLEHAEEIAGGEFKDKSEKEINFILNQEVNNHMTSKSEGKSIKDRLEGLNLKKNPEFVAMFNHLITKGIEGVDFLNSNKAFNAVVEKYQKRSKANMKAYKNAIKTNPDYQNLVAVEDEKKRNARIATFEENLIDSCLLEEPDVFSSMLNDHIKASCEKVLRIEGAIEKTIQESELTFREKTEKRLKGIESRVAAMKAQGRLEDHYITGQIERANNYVSGGYSPVMLVNGLHLEKTPQKMIKKFRNLINIPDKDPSYMNFVADIVSEKYAVGGTKNVNPQMIDSIMKNARSIYEKAQARFTDDEYSAKRYFIYLISQGQNGQLTVPEKGEEKRLFQTYTARQRKLDDLKKFGADNENLDPDFKTEINRAVDALSMMMFTETHEFKEDHFTELFENRRKYFENAAVLTKRAVDIMNSEGGKFRFNDKRRRNDILRGLREYFKTDLLKGAINEDMIRNALSSDAMVSALAYDVAKDSVSSEEVYGSRLMQEAGESELLGFMKKNLTKARINEFNALSDEQRKAFYLALSMPTEYRQSDAFEGARYLRSSEDDSKDIAEEITASIYKALRGEYTELISYEHIMDSLVKSKEGFEKEIFDKAMALVKECDKNRSPIFTKAKWDTLNNPMSSIKTLKYLPEVMNKNKKGEHLDNMLKGLDKIQSADQFKTSLIEQLREQKLDSLANEIADEGFDIRTLILVLQNRTILDNSTVKGQENRLVNPVMRNELIRRITESGRDFIDKHSTMSDCHIAMKSLYSYQLRDDVEYDGINVWDSHVAPKALNRKTAIDDKLLRRAIDYIKEIEAVKYELGSTGHMNLKVNPVSNENYDFDKDFLRTKDKNVENNVARVEEEERLEAFEDRVRWDFEEDQKMRIARGMEVRYKMEMTEEEKHQLTQLKMDMKMRKNKRKAKPA